MLVILVFLIFFLNDPNLIFAKSISKSENTQSVSYSSESLSNKTLPHFKEIRKILDNLEYSNFYVFINPQSKLSLDFKNRQWIVHNSRQFDAQGKIVLHQDRFGLCAELAIYAFDKIQPLLSDQEVLRFAMVTQKEFFPTIESNHIVLLLFEQNLKQVYLIDPSFKIYDKSKETGIYEVYDFKDDLSIAQKQSLDDIYLVDTARPILIIKDVLISLSVNTLDKVFDKENFLLTLSGKLKNSDNVIDFIILGKHKGEYLSFVNNELFKEFFTDHEIQILIAKFNFWLNEFK